MQRLLMTGILSALILFLLTVASDASMPRSGQRTGPTLNAFVKREYESVEAFVKRMFTNYTKLIRPRPAPERSTTKDKFGPTVVKLGISIDSFTDVSVKEMSYTVHMYVRMYWVDSRLRFENYSDNILLNSRRDDLWLPDLYFPKAVDSREFSLKSPSFSLWLGADGGINYSQLMTVQISCIMDLQDFPQDCQKCSLEIGSYSYRAKDIMLHWFTHKALQMNGNITLSEFTLRHETGLSYTIKESKLGTFSYVRQNFILNRKFGFYMIYTYLPSMLIMAICWLSFFIDFKAAPARISLGLLSILSLITQSSGVIQNLPRVSYIKAIDVWIFTCLAFVASSLVEFAIVNALCRDSGKTLQDMIKGTPRKILKKSTSDRNRRVMQNITRRLRRESTKSTNDIVTVEEADKEQEANAAMETLSNKEDNIPVSPTAPPMKPPRGEFSTEETEGKVKKKSMYLWKVETGYKIDKALRFLFPLAFLLFNIIYWSTFRPQKDKIMS